MSSPPPDPPTLLRSARQRAGVSQRRLALRAGTSQDAISRIERGEQSPTVDRLRELLRLLGYELELGVRPLPADPAAVAARRSLTPAERLRESASWNLVATRIEVAAAEQRTGGAEQRAADGTASDE